MPRNACTPPNRLWILRNSRNRRAPATAFTLSIMSIRPSNIAAQDAAVATGEASRCALLRSVLGECLEEVSLVARLVRKHHAIADHEQAGTRALLDRDLAVALDAEIHAV